MLGLTLVVQLSDARRPAAFRSSYNPLTPVVQQLALLVHL
jgi:hypothetical protein